jgi:CRISPR system Cascade subunit CasD
MPHFLLFRLHGPLAAWGDIAVGEERPTTSANPCKLVASRVRAARLLALRSSPPQTSHRLSRGSGDEPVPEPWTP